GPLDSGGHRVFRHCSTPIAPSVHDGRANASTRPHHLIFRLTKIETPICICSRSRVVRPRPAAATSYDRHHASRSSGDAGTKRGESKATNRAADQGVNQEAEGRRE